MKHTVASKKERDILWVWTFDGNTQDSPSPHSNKGLVNFFIYTHVDRFEDKILLIISLCAKELSKETTSDVW